MDKENKHVKAIRNFMIKAMKRYIADMELMKNVVIQNADAFETEKDILEQFDILKRDFKGVIDYNFYPVEIEVVEKDLNDPIRSDDSESHS